MLLPPGNKHVITTKGTFLFFAKRTFLKNDNRFSFKLEDK